MQINELLNSDNTTDVIIDFLKFAKGELALRSIPSVKILSKHIESAEANSFAAYSPPNQNILLYVKNRHILDVLRSLCHELVHYRQDLAGELKTDSGITGSEHENEANSVAGQVMRKYGKIHPELF